MMAEKSSIKKYLRGMKFPFCAGCGLFGIVDSFLRAVQELGYKNFKKFVFCSGIGCSSWIPSPFFLADSIHTLHGRSIPVATGIKLRRPDLNVVVFGGDGDLMGIGLGHFMHAARRNLDILVVMSNNMIYGMTGGQVAPTTPFGAITTTTPYGNFEQPFDAASLAVAAGATFSARWTTAHLKELKKTIKIALGLNGFRFIEVVSHCPTGFGRKRGLKTPQEFVDWVRDNAISIGEARKIGKNKQKNKIVIGEFIRKPRLTLIENIYAITREAQKLGKEN
ncbi:MAG: 2-oxoacid:ferredoxin oxidoreductase subunit beta [Candidatus Bathyarchaeota archaeon]|nr:MAG: 2-oxoacid:ferredoxin oxidoreductase subunit beta [Candidatus Bathyarchaeota archaeon]